MSKVIELRNISKYYYLFDRDYKKLFWLITKKGNTSVKAAVDDVSFSISKGEMVGLIGSNGAGKSTILKLIAEITQPTNGEITINGRVTSFINLSAGFIPDFSGRRNLYHKATLMGMDKKEIDKKIERIINFADIGEYIDLPIKTYSTGMRTRLGFALATFSNPDIMILDEVFAVGDRKFRNKSLRRIEKMLESGCTVIMASHAEERIKKYCSRVLLMDKGRLVFNGESKEAFKFYNKL